MTVSIGGVNCETSETSLERLVSRADTLLYAAKQAGRNRCMIDAVPGQGTLELPEAREA